MESRPFKYPLLDPNGRMGGYEFFVPPDADEAWFHRATDIADGWAEGRGVKNIGYTISRVDGRDYLVFLVERIPFGIRARRALARAPREAWNALVGVFGSYVLLAAIFGLPLLAIVVVVWIIIGIQRLTG